MVMLTTIALTVARKKELTAFLFNSRETSRDVWPMRYKQCKEGVESRAHEPPENGIRPRPPAGTGDRTGFLCFIHSSFALAHSFNHQPHSLLSCISSTSLSSWWGARQEVPTGIQWGRATGSLSISCDEFPLESGFIETRLWGEGERDMFTPSTRSVRIWRIS